MKKLLLIPSFLIAFTSVNGQNVGISTGTFTPAERLHVDGNARVDQAFMINPPAAVSPGATITVASQTSVIVISNNATTPQANAISYTGTAGAGQILYIYNGDNDAASFAGTDIPAGGMGTFINLVAAGVLLVALPAQVVLHPAAQPVETLQAPTPTLRLQQALLTRLKLPMVPLQTPTL